MRPTSRPTLRLTDAQERRLKVVIIALWAASNGLALALRTVLDRW